MSYDYVRRTYSVEPVIGERIRHHVGGKTGTISRENPSSAHYVMVKFDGQKHALPCHPTEMDYLGEAKP